MLMRDYEAHEIVVDLVYRRGFTEAVRLIGVNKGHVYRSWQDAVHSPTLRRALGLPPLKVEVEPCPDCGEVHEQLHQCPDDLERQRRKRPDVSTVAFKFRDHALAARFRALVDGHAGGRYGWVREVLEDV